MRAQFSAAIDWQPAPSWVGLNAAGVTELHGEFEYRGARIQSVETRRGDLVTNDPTVCAPYLGTELTLTLRTADGAVDQEALVRWAAFRPGLVTSVGRLRTEQLVAEDVRVDWDERIDSGERLGRLVASLEEPEGSGGALRVHALAKWKLTDGGLE